MLDSYFIFFLLRNLDVNVNYSQELIVFQKFRPLTDGWVLDEFLS